MPGAECWPFSSAPSHRGRGAGAPNAPLVVGATLVVAQGGHKSRPYGAMWNSVASVVHPGRGARRVLTARRGGHIVNSR